MYSDTSSQSTSILKILFVGNQGGLNVSNFYNAIVGFIQSDYVSDCTSLVLLDRERRYLLDSKCNFTDCFSFQAFVASIAPPSEAEVSQIRSFYRDINWSEVIAAERSFTDYSMLLGAAGERIESMSYVVKLTYYIVRFLEAYIPRSDAVVCQTPDTLFSLIAFKIARHFRVPIFAIAPAWLLEPGQGGGFFATNEYLQCAAMSTSYISRTKDSRPLTYKELGRIETLLNYIKTYDGKTSFWSKTTKGKQAGKHSISPNTSRLLHYLYTNSRRDKLVEYFKVSPFRKTLANVLRFYRKRTTLSLMSTCSLKDIPSNSVFYAMHYQPEQSTLAQGIWHVNQIALIENISKSLPLGFTLVVKEHPWGRGNRPAWQYRHLAELYNVVFVDASSKAIIQSVKAVITVSGTVAVESLVFDKPAVLLGTNFFDYCDLFYKASSIECLPELLARILIDNDYYARDDRLSSLYHFLLSYLDGCIPFFPRIEHAQDWAHALTKQIQESTNPQQDLQSLNQ